VVVGSAGARESGSVSPALRATPALTDRVAHPIFIKSHLPTMAADPDDLKALEHRIDELIEACQRLKSENQELRMEQDQLNVEHAKLVEKTRIARERIESMIGRLKALERSGPG